MVEKIAELIILNKNRFYGGCEYGNKKYCDVCKRLEIRRGFFCDLSWRTTKLKADGHEVGSGSRTAGDGYYESCIAGIEENQMEITV